MTYFVQTRWCQPLFAMVTFLLMISVSRNLAAQTPSAGLPRAHAHNDYEHDRPLEDAYELGFRSLEADIYLVDGKLLVAHDREDVKTDRTLQRLYLDPLKKRFDASQGKLFAGDAPLILLIDIKSDATETYEALHEALQPYRLMLTREEDGKSVVGAMMIVISGNRDFDAISNTPNRLVGIDGRTKDLESNLGANLMPLISDNWYTQFTWRGNGPMPEDQREHLREYVRKAHAAGRMVRFWATPEREALWDELRSADVDLIGTDELEKLAKFLREPVAPDDKR